MSLDIVIRNAVPDDVEERTYIENMTDRHIFHVAEQVDNKQIVGIQTQSALRK